MLLLLMLIFIMMLLLLIDLAAPDAYDAACVDDGPAIDGGAIGDRFYCFASCGRVAKEDGTVLYWIPYMVPQVRNSSLIHTSK